LQFLLEPQQVLRAFKIDNGHGFLVRRGDQGGDQDVEQLAIAACERQRGGLCRSKMAVDEVIERADWEGR
jgi:hypothetical protein